MSLALMFPQPLDNFWHWCTHPFSVHRRRYSDWSISTDFYMAFRSVSKVWNGEEGEEPARGVPVGDF